MATTHQRTGVPSLNQLRLAYVLSLVPADATHDEFQTIKHKADSLFDQAMNRERADSWAESLEYLEGIGGAELQELEIARAANPYRKDGDPDD